MKKFFQKVKDWFSDNADTWDSQPPNLPVRRLPNRHQATPQNNQALPPRGFSPFEWREQMMENEFTAQSCTRENKSIKVFGLCSGGNIPSSGNHESFTEDGLVSAKTEVLLTSADGRLIKPEELHGGGKCSNCQALTDKIYFCAVCKLPLCSRCVKNYRDMHVCQKHLQELNFKEDSWSVTDE